MRNFMLLVLLFSLNSSVLFAQTFFDRFKTLENEVNVVKKDVDGIKTTLKKSGVKIQNVSSSKTADSEQLDAIKEAIDDLKSEQSALKAKIGSLKSGSSTTVLSVSKSSAINADEDDDSDALDSEDEDATDSEKSTDSEVSDESDDEEDDGLGDILGEDDGEDEGEDDDEDMSEMEELQQQVGEIHAFTNNNHLKLNADFRTAYDDLMYTAADGTTYQNHALFSNRFWIDMVYKANKNMSFTAQLAYNKFYGATSGTGNFDGFSTFDWVTNENPHDDTVRVKKAYYFYRNSTFVGMPLPWTFSLGRRPSTNGHLINLRDDDVTSSPLGHSINVEFDGGSSKFDLSQVLGIQGMYIKLCFGRGLTNVQEKFTTAPYAHNDSDINNVDLAGFIFSIYDDGQYKLTTQTYRAWDLIGVDSTTCNPMVQTDCNLKTVGNLNSFTVSMIAEGLGDDISEFFDETTLFASYAISQTDPTNTAIPMLGSATAQTGSSYWVGIQTPSFSENGKFGLEYNHGDKYWRSVTYAEDTLIGSKVAARGSAYEFYWTEPFSDGSMSWQIRYTYIDYDYTGSNNFFGTDGTPMTMAEAIAGGMGAYAIDKSQDIRFYLRYRY